MQWSDYTTLPSRGLGLRPIGKSSECFRMTAGVKSGKAQNERMFFRFAPQRGHRKLASMCPLGAVKALRAAALHDGASARAWRVRLVARFSIVRAAPKWRAPRAA